MTEQAAMRQRNDNKDRIYNCENVKEKGSSIKRLSYSSPESREN